MRRARREQSALQWAPTVQTSRWLHTGWVCGGRPRRYRPGSAMPVFSDLLGEFYGPGTVTATGDPPLSLMDVLYVRSPIAGLLEWRDVL